MVLKWLRVWTRTWVRGEQWFYVCWCENVAALGNKYGNVDNIRGVSLENGCVREVYSRRITWNTMQQIFDRWKQKWKLSEIKRMNLDQHSGNYNSFAISHQKWQRWCIHKNTHISLYWFLKIHELCLQSQMAPPDTPRSEESRNFLHRGASEQNRIHRARELAEKMRAEKKTATTTTTTVRKPSIPRANDVASLAPRHNTNYINQNFQSACQAPSGRIHEEKDDDTHRRHKEFGKIPEYLHRRRQEQHEMERQRIVRVFIVLFQTKTKNKKQWK